MNEPDENKSNGDGGTIYDRSPWLQKWAKHQIEPSPLLMEAYNNRQSQKQND